MTTIETTTEAVALAAPRPLEIDGVAGWAVTADSTRIGRLYAGTALVGLIGMLAVGSMLLIERVDPSDAWLDPRWVGPLTSLWWQGLAFLGVVPLLVGLGIAVVPLQLGTPQVAMARAAAFSYWTWLFSGIVLVVSVLVGGGPGGTEPEAEQLFVLGYVAVLGALAVGAVCVATTVLTYRPPTMRLLHVPPFSFGSLVFSSALVLTLAMVAAKAVTLFVDVRYGPEAFDAGVGPELAWATLQSANYVYAIPVLAFAAEVFPVFAGVRQPRRGATMLFLGLSGVAVVGAAFMGLFLVEYDNASWWSDLMGTAVYGVTTVLPALAVLGVLGGCLHAWWKGRMRYRSPVFFALVALLMLLTGALVGLLTPFADLDLATTVYADSQALYVLLAAALAGMGALVYWGPKLTGRRIPDDLASVLPIVGLVAIVLAAFPEVIAGFNNVPRADVTTDAFDGQELLATISAYGLVLFGITTLLFAVMATWYLARGARIGDDPWDGQTLEWAMPSPAAGTRVDLEPILTPQPLLDRKLAPSMSTGGEL